MDVSSQVLCSLDVHPSFHLSIIIDCQFVQELAPFPLSLPLPPLPPTHSESVHPAAQIIDACYVPGIVLGPRNPEWEIVDQRRQALEKDCFMVFQL